MPTLFYIIYSFFYVYTGERKLTGQHLMADAADAITNGFAAVFGCESHRNHPHPIDRITKKRPICPSFKRGMCYFHVKQAVEKNINAK